LARGPAALPPEVKVRSIHLAAIESGLTQPLRLAYHDLSACRRMV